MKKLTLFLAAAISLAAQSFSNVTIVPKQDDSTTGTLDFREKYQNGQNYVGWKAPANIRTSFRLTLPSTAPPGTNSIPYFKSDSTSAWTEVPSFSMTDTNWSQTISTNMSTPGTYTLTLSPAPLGVSAAITDSQYRLSGSPGAAELVTPTGVGTCDGTIQDSCTIQIITANAHAANSTLSSSTEGLQEAWNAGRKNLSCPDGIHTFYGTAKTGAINTTLSGTAYCVLAPASNNMTVLWANSIYAMNLQGIAFNSLGTKTGVTYILLGAGNSSNSGSTFTDINLSASSGGYGIDARRGHEVRVSNSTFNQLDSSGGGSAIRVGNIVFGDYWAGWFKNNKILGDWQYGIEDAGSGLIGTKNVFNGPKTHMGFNNWTSVVNVNGTAVTWVSGDPFSTAWTGFVEIDGQLGTISSVGSTTSITLSNSLGTITNGKLRHGSTGQILWEGNTHDSGTAYYTGGFVALPTANSFYNIRIVDNFCSNWNNVTFTNCIYLSMQNATGVVISNNSAQNSSATGSHYGINLPDIGDAVITGNNLINYTSVPIFASFTAANNPSVSISGNRVTCNLAATTYGYEIGKGRFNVSGNSTENCDIGVLADSGATGYVTGTTFLGSSTSNYQISASSTMIVNDQNNNTYASLLTNVKDGSRFFCTDCTSNASGTCISGGTGAYATKLNSIWSCATSTSSGISYVPARTSGTVLTLPAIAANTLSVGNNACGAIAAGATFTVSSGTGTIWIALGYDCTIYARHNIVGSCSAGCTAVSSSSGFLQTDLQLYTWTVTAGVLSGSGTAVPITPVSNPLTAGANITLATSAGVTTISGSAAFNPLDRSTIYLRDEFTPAIQNDAATIILGNLGWMRQNNVSAAYSTTNLSANHPGILRVTNPSSTTGAIDLAASSAAVLSNPTAYANWEVQFTFRVSSIAANNTYRMGLYNAFAASPTDYFGLMFTGGTDTNWQVVMRAASGSTLQADSGVAASTSSWYTMRIRSISAGTVLVSFSTDGGAFSTEKTICASSCNVTGTMPTTNMVPFVYAYNSVGTTSVDIDWFGLYATGLTR